MLLIEAFREAIRSLTATPLRFGLLLTVVTAGIAVSAVREASLTLELRDAASSRVEAGEFVYIVNLPDSETGGIEGDECQRLSSIQGILASGVESESKSVVFDRHPKGSYRSVLTTQGRIAIANQDIRFSQQGLPLRMLGASSSEEMGLAPIDMVSIQGTPEKVYSMVSAGARTATIDRALVTVAAPTHVRGICYVEFLSVAPDEASAVLPALLEAGLSSVGVSVLPLVEPERLGPTPVERYRSRPDSELWAVLVAMSFLPIVLVTRTRRNEIATYAMFGAPAHWISLVLLIEFLVLLSVAFSISLAVLVLAVERVSEVLEPSLEASSRYMAWLALVEIVFVVVLPLRQSKLYELMRRSD